jgi:hypothetical protein
MLWRSITPAGLIVADVSVPYPSVYYEIGLADVLANLYAFTRRALPTRFIIPFGSLLLPDPLTRPPRGLAMRG